MKNLSRTVTDENAPFDPVIASVDREGFFHLRQGDDRLAFNRKTAQKLRDALDDLIQLTMEKFRFSRAARATAIVAALGLVSIWYNPPGSLTGYKTLKLKHVTTINYTRTT